VLIWNLNTGELVSPDQGEVFERAISYVDGGKKIVVGYSTPERTSQRAATGVWQVGTGRRVLNLLGTSVADVSATGNLVAVYDGESPHTANNKRIPWRGKIVDLATGKTLWRSSKLGSDLRFSRDGKKLASFGPAVKVLDARNGKELSRLELEDTHAIAICPNLRYAVHADSAKGKLRLLDLASGRQFWQSNKLPKPEQQSCIILFSPDSERLAAYDFDNNLSLWQTKTGKPLVRTQIAGRLLAFLPNCHTLLSQEGEDDEDDVPYIRTFGFGQETLSNVLRGYSRTHPRETGDLLEENRTESQEFFDYVGPNIMGWTFQRDFGSIASPDSKILVTATDPYQIQVWETATGRLLCRLNGERDGAHMPVLSPDCRTVTTRNANGTITAWDITGLGLAEQKGRLPVSAAEFEHCWASFADERDGKKFFQAFWKLAADPDQTVTRLTNRLKPVPKMTDPKHTKQINQWIADLDSKEFAVRARAEKELGRDESALPILCHALETKLSLEARQRLSKIVQKLQAGPKGSPASLRAYRLVQLLEQIGSPSARDLLRTLSRGAEGAMLTTEAQTSLRRLGGR
jgi:WD40 repeat protein